MSISPNVKGAVVSDSIIDFSNTIDSRLVMDALTDPAHGRSLLRAVADSLVVTPPDELKGHVDTILAVHPWLVDYLLSRGAASRPAPLSDRRAPPNPIGECSVAGYTDG